MSRGLGDVYKRQKQERVDKAVRMLKLYSAANALKDSGLLGSLDSLL